MVSSSVSEFLSKYFLCNYFLLMTVDVLLVWCGLAAIAKFELIILLSAIIISLNKLRNQTTRMDLFIIFFSISIAIASLSNIYPQAFWFEGVRYQLFSIIFFFYYFPNIKFSVCPVRLYCQKLSGIPQVESRDASATSYL